MMGARVKEETCGEERQRLGWSAVWSGSWDGDLCEAGDHGWWWRRVILECECMRCWFYGFCVDAVL
jgi:hypothetical protein